MKFDKATVLTIAAGLLTLTGALVSNVASNENSKKTDYVSRKEFEELAKKIKSNWSKRDYILVSYFWFERRTYIYEQTKLKRHH